MKIHTIRSMHPENTDYSGIEIVYIPGTKKGKIFFAPKIKEILEK